MSKCFDSVEEKNNQPSRALSIILTSCRKVGITGKQSYLSLFLPCLFCQTPKRGALLSIQSASSPMKYPDIIFTNTTVARRAGFIILNWFFINFQSAWFLRLLNHAVIVIILSCWMQPKEPHITAEVVAYPVQTIRKPDKSFNKQSLFHIAGFFHSFLLYQAHSLISTLK